MNSQKPQPKLQQNIFSPPIIQSISQVIYFPKFQGYQFKIKWKGNHCTPPYASEIFVPQHIFYSVSLIAFRKIAFIRQPIIEQPSNFNDEVSQSKFSSLNISKSHLNKSHSFIPKQISCIQPIRKDQKKINFPYLLKDLTCSQQKEILQIKAISKDKSENKSKKSKKNQKLLESSLKQESLIDFKQNTDQQLCLLDYDQIVKTNLYIKAQKKRGQTMIDGNVSALLRRKMKKIRNL